MKKFLDTTEKRLIAVDRIVSIDYSEDPAVIYYDDSGFEHVDDDNPISTPMKAWATRDQLAEMLMDTPWTTVPAPQGWRYSGANVSRRVIFFRHRHDVMEAVLSDGSAVPAKDCSYTPVNREYD